MAEREEVLRRYREDARFRECVNFMRDAVRSGVWQGDDVIAAAKYGAELAAKAAARRAARATANAAAAGKTA